MSALQALQRCALFRDFTETGLRIFAALAVEKQVPAGSPLFVEGMAGESLFIVRRGLVRISQKGEKGDRELGELGPGEHLGALALLAPSIRLVSATAVEDCDVLELMARDFLKLQPSKPQACLKLALAIATDVAARIGENRDLVRELGTRKPA